MAIKNVVLRGYGNGTVAGTAALVVTRGYGLGAAAATTPAAAFRRRLTDRRFRRPVRPRRFARRATSRLYRGFARMAQIDYDTRVKDASETVVFVFDFSRFPEVVGGETLSSPQVDAVGGLTIGTPAVTAADETVDANGSVVEAGAGVKVAISGGTAGTTYALECRATCSGGSVRVVKGSLVVE